MQKRLFIAIPLSKDFRKKVLDWKNNHRDLPVRWLSGHNLHITIIPPFYLEDESLVVKILENLKNEISPFELNFLKISFGPSPYNPRFIWTEGKNSPEILKLKQKIEKIFFENKIIEKIENRPFSLHMTLARFRPEDFQKFPQKNLQEKFEYTKKINSIVLMQSHLKSSGAEYEILHEVKFQSVQIRSTLL